MPGYEGTCSYSCNNGTMTYEKNCTKKTTDSCSSIRIPIAFLNVIDGKSPYSSCDLPATTHGVTSSCTATYVSSDGTTEVKTLQYTCNNGWFDGVPGQND